MLRFLASTSNNGHLPRVERMREAGAFLHLPPQLCEQTAYLKRRGFSDPNQTILPQRASIGARPKKSIPTWPARAAPHLAPVALSPEIGRSVPSRTVN